MKSNVIIKSILFSIFISICVPYAQAQSQYEQAIRMYVAAKEWADARRVAEMWIVDSPDSRDANRAYVETCLESGHARQAIPHAEFLATYSPNTTHDSMYCRALWQAGEMEKAHAVAHNVQQDFGNWTFVQPFLGNRVDSEKRIWQRIEPAMSRVINLKLTIDPTNGWYALMTDGDGFIKVPFPKSGLGYQECNYKVEGAADYGEAWFGDERYLLVRADGNREFVIDCEVFIIPEDKVSQAKLATDNYPSQYQQYLQSSVTINYNHSSIQSLVPQLQGKTRFDTVKNILDFCNENIYYRGNPQIASDVLANGGSHCEGRSSLAVALLRASEVPARLLRGHSAVVGDSGFVSHHTIVEYYLDSTGWLPWDFQQAAGVISPRGFVVNWRYPRRVKAPELTTHETIELWNFHGLDMPDYRLGRPRYGSFEMLGRY